MMDDLRLKPLSPAGLARALVRAEQFRLLNEGREAESICRDVLAVDPENQAAISLLVLALCDQFASGRADLGEARRLASRLHDAYERTYHQGVVYERWAKARHLEGTPDLVTSDYLREAMRAFEEAEAIRPAGNDDARLRWNSCVRLIRADAWLRRKFDHFGLHDEGLDTP